MNIVLNGEETEVADEATIADVLKEKGVDPKTVIVEADEIIVKPEEFDKTSLKEGSVLEVLRFVGGG